MAPKTTCRAFQPDNRISAASPRRAQPARRGGNKSKSVSSSASTTLRGGKARTCPRMWRFFLHVRVFVQDIAVAFPDIAQAVQGAANGIVGKACVAGTLEMILQEWHGPIDRQMTKLIGWHGNRVSQERLGLAGPAWRATGAH